MVRNSKRNKQIKKEINSAKTYKVKEAIETLKKCPSVKFDQTVELSVKLGVDVKKTDQQVRGNVSLPHGTGKAIKVLVLATGNKVKEAQDAGADFVGSQEFVEKIKNGWVEFDAVVATPDMMREVGKLGKILGPRGLMPTPKAGTVTTEVGNAIQEIKAGKIEFKLDKHGVCNRGVGKLSFKESALEENIDSFLKAIAKAKPLAAKGQYFLQLILSSTMGPGLKIDISDLAL